MEWLRAASPQRSSVPADVWRSRQRCLRLVLWAHVAALAVFAAARGHTGLKDAGGLLLVALLAGLAQLHRGSPQIQRLLVALGLLAASALLVHLWDGHPGAQLHPFLVLLLIMLYEDWTLIALAVLSVLGGHIVRGSAWEPAATHTLFVALAGVVAVWLAASLRSEAHEAHEATQRQKRFLHADGQTIWVNLSLSSVFGGQGTPEHFIAQIEDVTERKRTVDQLQHLADHDALTGLLNRRRLEHEIERQIAFSERYERTGCLVLLDLDDFKSTNDAFGHAAGDEVLRNVADLLRGRVRRSDIVARLDGDEFAILLPQANREQARRVAEGIAGAIRERVHITAGHEVRTTASFGIATVEADDSASRVLLHADQAMYRAKDQGRDGVAIARLPLPPDGGDAGG